MVEKQGCRSSHAISARVASAIPLGLSLWENLSHRVDDVEVTRKSDPAALLGGLPLRFTLIDLRRVTLQRLFSTFANGLPGKGLMVLRLAVSTFLIYDAVKRLSRAEVSRQSWNWARRPWEFCF